MRGHPSLRHRSAAVGLLGAFLSTGVRGAEARTLVHLNKMAWGCFNPSVAAIINDGTNPRRSDPAWVAKTSEMGECVTITPHSVWEALTADRDGFTYVAYRGTTAKPGSFWVPTASLVPMPPELTPPPPVVVKPEQPPPPPPILEVAPRPSPVATDEQPTQQQAQQPTPPVEPDPLPTSAPTAGDPPPSGGGGGASLVVFLVLATLCWAFIRGARKKRKAVKQTGVRVPPPTVKAPSRSSPATRPSPKGRIPAALSPPIWHPPDQQVQVRRHWIVDGMIYVGNVSSRSGFEDVCVVDPALEVASSGASGRLGYWPSYAGMSPESRRGYLEWLATGKRAPHADIGFVFLYFYGLERRLFLDAPSTLEVDRLASEVERLRSIYVENHSFDGYSRRLLETVALLRGAASGLVEEPQAAPGQMSLALKVAVGREVTAERPLGFDLASAVLIGLKDFQPSSRLVLGSGRGTFLAVLKARFKTAFPTGLLVRNRKDSHLHLAYHGAMAGLNVDLTVRAGLKGLPDPATLSWTKLLALGATVAEEITPHLKAMAYHPDRADSLAALAQCPPELRDVVAARARRWAEGLPAVAAVPFGDVAGHAIGTATAKWTVRHRRQVAEALAEVGLAMEPEPEDGGRPMEDDTTVYVFRSTGGRSRAMTLASAAAMFVTYLGRGGIVPVEAVDEVWLGRLPSRLALTQDETIRLRARLAWLRDANLSMTKVKHTLGDATAEENEFCAWSATVAAGASGTVDKAKVAVLERICDALGVAPSLVYGGLHMDLGAASASADEPVVVLSEVVETSRPIPRPGGPRVVAVTEPDRDRLTRVRAEAARISAMLPDIHDAAGAHPEDVGEAAHGVHGFDAAHAGSAFDGASVPADESVEVSGEVTEAGHSVPPLEVQRSAVVTDADRARLDRIRAETARVSDMLQEIFKEEEVLPEVAGETGGAFPGLDAAHAGLVARLIVQPEWTRPDYEEAARSFDLMPGGAMEAINEWSFDLHGDALLEDGDVVVVNRALVPEEAEVAAAAE